MLTKHDIEMMESDVCDIITMWDTKVNIIRPLPIEQQPNWNVLMHEYTGQIMYDTIYDVPAERRDIQNMTYYNVDIDPGGDKDNGSILLSIPDIYSIDTDCIIEYNGEKWMILTIKYRIGEYIILISRNIGSNDNWGNTNV